METIGNTENMKDVGAGIYAVPSEKIESDLPAETRVAMIKNALRVVLKKTLEDLNSTPKEMEQAFNEIEKEGIVYEINTDKEAHA